jgi:hypothetical protein
LSDKTVTLFSGSQRGHNRPGLWIKIQLYKLAPRVERKSVFEESEINRFIFGHKAVNALGKADNASPRAQRWFDPAGNRDYTQHTG